MKFREFAKRFTFLLIVLLVALLLLPGAIMAQDDPASTAVETTTFETNTPRPAATESPATDEPTPAETLEVIVVTIEVTPEPPAPGNPELDDQIGLIESLANAALERLANAALDRFALWGIIALVVIGMVSAIGYWLLWKSNPERRTEIKTSAGKQLDALQASVETRRLAAQQTLDPIDDIQYNLLAAALQRLEDRLNLINPTPPTSPTA